MPSLSPEHFLFSKVSAQGRDLAPIFGDVSQSERLSETKPLLAKSKEIFQRTIDARSFLFHSLSMTLQRGNALCVMGTVAHHRKLEEIYDLGTKTFTENWDSKRICWNSLGLFRDYSLNHIFFRNKTFLFFKIEN
jgi:hypothetical protein